MPNFISAFVALNGDLGTQNDSLSVHAVGNGGNPALRFSEGFVNKEVTVEAYDLLGRKVLREQFKVKIQDVEIQLNLPQGIAILVIKSEGFAQRILVNY